MRCGCPECGQFMVHEEGGAHLGCVCPSCLYRCAACLGTNSMISREEVERLKQGEPDPRVELIETDLQQVAEDDEDLEAIEALAQIENPNTEAE